MTSKIVNANDMICFINISRIARPFCWARAGFTPFGHITRTGWEEKAPAKGAKKVPAAIFNGASFRVHQFCRELAEIVESRDVQNE